MLKSVHVIFFPTSHHSIRRASR